MKVVTAEQMRAADRYTIEQLGVPSLELMERAGTMIAEVAARDPKRREIAVVCGTGNNGGDGWVVARRLRAMGRRVTVFPVAGPAECSPDCREMWRRATRVRVAKFDQGLEGFDTVVDAVYGTGYDPSRAGADTRAMAALRAIATASRRVSVCSVDIPSGLDATTGEAAADCVRADETITVQYPKLGMFQGSGPDVTGRLWTVEIGIRLPTAEDLLMPEMLTAETFRELLPRLSASAHKGTRGSVLCVGGSTTMPGSVALTGLGALCAGAGLVTCAVPESIHPIVAGFFPELIPVPLPDAGMGCLTPEAAEAVLAILDRFDVVALGPGVTTQPPAREAVRAILSRAEKPVVLDADGLNCLAELGAIATASSLTLTPHPGEMARLLGKSTAEVLAQRFDCARNASSLYRATIVLKGAYTVVCDQNGATWVSRVVCPGLGTAGSGDVLTGAVATLTHQTLNPATGALLGVYLHGLAGELCVADNQGPIGFTAEEIARRLPQARGFLD